MSFRRIYEKNGQKEKPRQGFVSGIAMLLENRIQNDRLTSRRERYEGVRPEKRSERVSPDGKVRREAHGRPMPDFLPSSIARTESAATVCAPDAKRQTSRDPQERSESDRASVRPSFRTRPREQSHTNHTDRFRPFSGTVRPLCLRAVPS